MVPDEQASPKRLQDEKEIKVKIPLEFHIKLHTLKVLKGQSISDTVEFALTRYFKQLSAVPEGQRIEALGALALQETMGGA
jgi:DNA-binding protein Fis